MHRTNVELDEKLVSKAMRLTQLSTKKQVINYALGEIVRRAERKKILNLKGKVKWIGNLDEMRESRV
jgi:Arc/MetJ family transcription regulator